MALFVCVSGYNDAEWLGQALPALRIGVSGPDVRWVYLDGAYKDFLTPEMEVRAEPNQEIARKHGFPSPEAYTDFLRGQRGARSADGSQALAARSGFEVYEGPEDGWEDECAKRSAYLLGQPGDWYFVVDADEVLVGAFPDYRTFEGDAYSIWMQREGCRKAAKPYVLPGRIFRHQDGLRYHGCHASVSQPDAGRKDGWRMLYKRGDWERGGPATWPTIPREQCWLKHLTAQRDSVRTKALKAPYYVKLRAREDKYGRAHGVVG